MQDKRQRWGKGCQSLFYFKLREQLIGKYRKIKVSEKRVPMIEWGHIIKGIKSQCITMFTPNPTRIDTI